MTGEFFADRWRTVFRMGDCRGKSMTSTVNEHGRLELPPEVATELGLKPGDRVQVETGNGLCVLRPMRADAQ